MNGGKIMTNDFHQEIEDKELALKEDIKRTGGKCSRILLILAISTYGIGYGTVFIIMGINYLLRSSSLNPLVFSNDARSFILGYLPCIIGDIIAIITAILITKVKMRRDIFTENKASKKFIFLGVVSCLGIGMISNIIYLIYSTILKLIGITIPAPDFSFPVQRGFLILFLIYVCLLGPIMEEIIFRGFILRSMQKYGNLTAIIVSSILFSMFHLNLVQFINPVLVGMLLAFIAIKSESIFPSMIAHVFNNTITFVIAAVSLLKMPAIGAAFNLVCIIFGVVAFILFISRYGNMFIETIKEDMGILKTHQKVRVAFSGGWSIAYIVFYIIFIIGTMLITNIMKVMK